MSEQNIVITQLNARPVNPFHRVPEQSDPIQRGGQIRYFLDDESSSLIQNIDVPTISADPPLSIQDYVGHADPSTPQGMAANCMVTLLSAQAMLRKYLGDSLPKWAATSVLRVYPLAGNQLNAFYDRVSLKFFSGVNPVNNLPVHTCLSNDTITHEFFHAVLDSLKPMLFNSPIIEQSAAHEGFADCGSILHAMSLDPILSLMAQQVDAHQISTVVSSIAPDLGYALNHVVGGLRDASVPFHYVDPQSLPLIGGPEILTRELHSFSRVLSSAFYACIVAIHTKVKAHDATSTREALIVARDIMANALFQAVKIAPITVRYMSSIADSMLIVLATSNYLMDVTQILSAWGLITGVQSVAVEIVEIHSDDRKEKIRDLEFFIREKHEKIILAEKIIICQNDNPLYFCMVEVPREEMLFSMGNNKAQILGFHSEEDSLNQIKLGLDYIWESDLVTLVGQIEKDYHLFKVDDNGSLLRKGYNYHDGYFNNAMLPGAPEFGKPWKPENNSGCCSGCKNKVEPISKPSKLGCYISERTCGSHSVRTCQVVRQKVC